MLSRNRPRYPRRLASQIMESGSVRALLYAAWATTSCESYRARVSALSGSTRSESPRNETASTTTGVGAAIGVSLVFSAPCEQATRTSNGKTRRMGWGLGAGYRGLGDRVILRRQYSLSVTPGPDAPGPGRRSWTLIFGLGHLRILPSGRTSHPSLVDASAPP